MKMNLYSIYDTVAKEYGPVFEAKNDDVAKRSFKQLAQQNDINLFEYNLTCIGQVDHDNGVVSASKVSNVDINQLELGMEEVDE